jgi:hypothetical protein
MNFLCYIFDYTCTLMTPNVDQIIAILDMADFSYENYSFEQWRSAMEVSNVSVF